VYLSVHTQTVEETLGYVAELRVPPSLTPEERKERVDAVIEVRGMT
jgi:ABC-type multidrug transport system ATPase subunit